MAEPATTDQISSVSRCFICLGDAGEPGDISDWVHPCPCSLEAHHACLLQWIDECERENKPLKCPVCQAPIRVEGARDLAVDLSDWFRNFINGFSPVLVGSMFGGAVMAGQALYGFHAIRIFAGEEAVMKIFGTGRLRDHIPALLGVPMIAPGLILHHLFPTFTAAIDTPLSILLSAVIVRNPDTLNWPPSPLLAFASLPSITMAYIFVRGEIFAGAERRWDRIIQGLPETPNRDNGAPPALGVGGGLRDIINNLADNLQGGPENAGGNERVEIWFDDGGDRDEAELIIDLIEEMDTDEDEDHDEGEQEEWETEEEDEEDEEEENAHRAPRENEQANNQEEARPEQARPQPQPEAEAQPRPAADRARPHPQAPAAPPQEPRRNEPIAIERAVRYSLRDLTSTILGALLLPSISWAAGEMLRFALPKAWTTMKIPDKPFLFAAPFRYGPTGLLQEKWGRSLAGGCMFLVLKDMFYLYVKYRRATIRPLRRVPNVEPRSRTGRPRP